MKHVMQADLKLGRRNIVSAVNKLRGGENPRKKYGFLWVSASRKAENIVKNEVSYRSVPPWGPKTSFEVLGD